jgi:hypothetical protein
MDKKGETLLRAAAVALLATTLVIVAFALWRTGEPVRALRTPALGPAPVAVRLPEVPEELRGTGEGFAKMRIGSFRPPEEAPQYKVLEEEVTRDGGTRAVRLLVDTRARGEADYELIARDLKARYAGYDAVSAEFTDTTDLLDYNGGALIFNTPDGAYYMGYIYGPPNNQGYYVQAVR